MQPTSRAKAFSVSVALAVSLVACDGPTRPSPGPPPPPPSGPVLVRLEIGGPATVAPGETAQFTATGHYSDGSTQNVTNAPGAIWGSSISRILAISSTGLATGGDRGEVSITIAYLNRSAVKSNVLVLPTGTYRLAGTIRDTGVPIVDVRVEVTHGAGTGQTTIANPAYRLYGVAGDTEIRVTKDGYREERKRIQVTGHETLDIELVPSTPRPNVQGTYSLQVTADAQCRGRLPDEGMQQTYAATLQQQGPLVTATLNGASFLSWGNTNYDHFAGTLEVDRMAFNLRTEYQYYGYTYSFPVVIASLDASTYIFLSGTAVTTPTPGGHAGTLSGEIGTMGGPPQLRRLTACVSTQHRFELVRR
jgi:hypothetical protein